MLILGIDPGVATIGYGLVKDEVDTKLIMVDYGWIETPKLIDQSDRLISIQTQLVSVIAKTKPDVISLEKLFFFANAKTAMMVAEAIGVIKLTCRTLNIPLCEYAPLRMKSLVTGSGRAKKPDIKRSVLEILCVSEPNGKKTHFDDVADALALAICHSISVNNPKKEVKKVAKR